ncbi:MAG: hypothetical protein CFK52_06790 [Chloracidobacterium sp. CP2_5A]|nr:MAG: hypothetical protein CFK52_06790 [Chloracidobacterium sp. CP2_5A]
MPASALTRSPLIRQVCVWGGALALCSVSAARSGVTPEAYGNDFTVFYAAARQAMLTGNPYDIAMRAATPYLYPPLFAQLLAPLALLPLPVAAGAWAVGNVVATLWLWRMARQVLDSEPHRGEAPAWLWRLALAPILGGNFLLGQVNLWIAAAVAFALLADAERRRSALGGLALALATSVKLSPILLLPYFIGRRAWRLLAWHAAWTLLLNWLSFALLGASRRPIIQSWCQEIIIQGWRFDFATPSNQSLYGALLRARQWLGGSGLPYWLLALLGAAWLFYAGHRARRAVGSAARQAAAAANAWCVLGAKLSWVAHFALLALPVAVALSAQAHRRLARASVLALAVCAWSSFQIVPERLRAQVEAWSLFTGAGLAIMLTLLQPPRQPPKSDARDGEAERPC